MKGGIYAVLLNAEHEYETLVYSNENIWSHNVQHLFSRYKSAASKKSEEH